VGVLQRFERRLGGLVEGVFARAFKSEVQPVEVASALQRELDDRAAIVSQGRTLVPNDFIVELGDHDHDRLIPYAEPLQDELAAMVREHAAAQGYTFVGPVHVTLRHDADLDTGVFHVRSDVVAGAIDPVPTPVQEEPEQVEQTPGSATPEPEQPAERWRPDRLLVHDSGSSYAVELTAPVTLVGRGPDAALRLTDPGVSRRHAQIVLQHDGAVVTDLNSTNGTRVNGVAVEQASLYDGDEIRLGGAVLVFRSSVAIKPGQATV
jgi:hypothetical protein